MIFSFKIALLIYFASPASATIYFGNDFDKAESKLNSYAELFSEIGNTFEEDPEILKSIVFPEFIRYSYLSDLMESFALEQLYAKYGSSMADFSIGDCQIKPSFAENIEICCRNNVNLKHHVSTIAEINSQESRTARIDRLKSIKWQITYVAMFVKVASAKFQLSNLSTEKKIMALATIYNRGISISKNKLKLLMNKKAFPNGTNAGLNSPYAYAAISLLYLKRNATKI